MIRRLYVDNYRCLVDFTWRPGSEALILGFNGSGKTSAIDALDLIRAWTGGWERLEGLLGSETITKWSTSDEVTFELDIQVGRVVFLYRVQFLIQRRGGLPTVQMESLRSGRKTYFERKRETVILSNSGTKPKLEFPVPLSQSAISPIFAAAGSEVVGDFLDSLSRMIIVRPMPPLIVNDARNPEPRAWYRFENFVAWYWHQTANGKFSSAMLGLLVNVWEEFDYLRLDQIGRSSMALSAVFSKPERSSGEFAIEFQELSEGERMLILLYTLVAYQRATPPTTMVIDEPDNFVGISELQPWLLQMLDDRPEGGQLLIISHNVEIMETMGESKVAYFSRADHLSATSVSEISPDQTGLSLSERLARGWIGAEA